MYKWIVYRILYMQVIMIGVFQVSTFPISCFSYLFSAEVCKCKTQSLNKPVTLFNCCV